MEDIRYTLVIYNGQIQDFVGGGGSTFLTPNRLKVDDDQFASFQGIFG